MALGRAYIEIVGDVRRFGPELQKGLKKAFAIGSIGTIAAAASTQLVGLAGALAQAGGAAVALPATIAVGGAAIGALKLATSGLGDAFSAAAEGDAKKFQKAIEDLSPQAQRLAKEFLGVKPALDSVKTATQDAFAGPLVGQIGATARVLSGPLRSGLAGIAAQYGEVARRALEFARQSSTVSALSRVMDTARVSVGNLGVATGPLLAGFRDLAVVALPTIERLSATAGGMAAKFGGWLSAMASSGAASAALERALGVLTSLGQVAVNVGGILSHVFQAAADASGNAFLGNLVRVTGTLNQFFASAQGGAALTGVFQALGSLAGGLSPVLTTLLGIIGDSLVPALLPVAQAIVPALQSLATGLAPAIAAIGGALGPVMTAVSQGVQALGPALAPIGQLIASMALAVAPVLPVIGQLITMLVGPLAQALTAIGPLIGPLVTALGPVLLQIGQTLTAVLAPVAGLLAQLFTQLGPPLGQIVVALGTALAPILGVLGPLVVTVVQALMPLIPTIVSLIPPLLQVVVALTPLIQLAAQLAAVAIQLVAPLIKLVAVLLQFLASSAIAPLIGAIASALAWLLSPLTDVAAWLGTVAGWLSSIDWGGVGSAISGAFSAAWNAVAGFFTSIGTWFAELPGKIGSFLASLPGMLLSAFGAAFDAALQAVGIGIGLLLFAVTQLPGLVIRGVMALPGMLASFFTSLWNNAKNLASQGISGLVSFVTALPGRVMSALSRLPGVLGGALSSAWNAARSAATTGANAVVSFITGVPGKIAGLAGKFVSAGKNLIDGFIRGFKNVGSFIGDVAGAIGSSIKGFLNRVIGKINSGIAKVDDVLPGSLPRIPLLANGGILRRPTLMVGGEAGDEVVIPLTRPRRAAQLAEESGLTRMLGGGAVNVAVRVFLGEREITDVVRFEVDRALDDEAFALAAGPRQI